MANHEIGVALLEEDVQSLKSALEFSVLSLLEVLNKGGMRFLCGFKVVHLDGNCPNPLSGRDLFLVLKLSGLRFRVADHFRRREACSSKRLINNI